jgi:hypothetical protein
VDDHLRAELLAMQEDDQRLRWRAIETDGEPAAAWWAVGDADRRHTARMREVVAEHGWPGHSLAGEDGAHAAWLLTQHADHDPEFQREYLALLATAVAAGEATAVDHAVSIAIAQARGVDFASDDGQALNAYTALTRRQAMLTDTASCGRTTCTSSATRLENLRGGDVAAAVTVSFRPVNAG